MKYRKYGLIALIAAVLVIGAYAGFRYWRAHRVVSVPPNLIPASWEEARKSPGHKLHVEQRSIACKECHDYERDGFKDPGPGPCAQCHEKQTSHSHEGDVALKTDCVTCHAFANEQQKIPSCISCHANAQTHAAAITTHATTPCADCHKIHDTPSVIAKDCTTCHSERILEHAKHQGSKGCADCHAPHTPALAAITTCSTCHAQPAGPKPANHDSCLTCHKPHAFAATPNVCVDCHGQKPTLLASTVQVHAVCTSCHAPHAPMQAASSCATCHSGIKVTHGGHDDCIGCHAPHGKNVEQKAVSCTSCHSKIASADSGVHAKGLACTSCHKPHDFEPPQKPQVCATCHAAEAASASHNAGHTNCASCHGASAHKPTTAPKCGTCHAKEQATAPAGHQVCTSCHAPHDGALPAKFDCGSCHAKEKSSIHGAIKGGCEDCHRPHGPGGKTSPPKCATCHASSSLPALHSVSGHQDCASCHTSHAPPKSDRATCTGTCHQDRRTHQPQVAVCSGCHRFTK
ncbi:MAG: hypothetical protein ABI461_23355 [Polyangiaceae bacterium]